MLAERRASRALRWSALVVGLGLLLGATAGPVAAVPADRDTGGSEITLQDAVLRWGMSNEANNAAFAPGTSNFFSAGRIADPGRGNVALTSDGWTQRAGDVAIEKWDGSAYRPATWAGLRTDQDGVAITSPGSGRYSGHQFVFAGGVGSVDPQAGTARISWDGDVTVLLYSGYTFFYLSDPVLDVAGGQGTLSATLSGFGSTREDPGAWVEIAPQSVTVGTLPEVDLSDARGFNANPAYDGVRTTLDGLTVTDSFPQPFVAFMNDLGIAPFWRKSGSASTDPAKRALPVTVSYDASVPVVGEEPEPQVPNPVVENEAPEPPTVITTTNTVTRTVRIPATPAVAGSPPAAALVPPLTVSPVVDLVAAEAATTTTNEPTWPWWLGGSFLLLAALILAGTAIPLPARRDPATGTP